MSSDRPISRGFYEFFAGGGMARAGLGQGWTCLFANDFDPVKAAAYRENWGATDLLVEDVGRLSSQHLPGVADLAWASFPCQDLSLAGNQEGLGRRDAAEPTRSGTFWAFWRLMEALRSKGRAPRMIMLENVSGVLTSNRGRDFSAIGGALCSSGYRFGAMVIDAKHFLPQSRPRVFILAVRRDLDLPDGVTLASADPCWHPDALRSAVASLPKAVREAWLWWNLPLPTAPVASFIDLIDDSPHGAPWRAESETGRLIALMSARNLAKLDDAKRSGKRCVGGLYRRTRTENGAKRQRAEIRFDAVAGCLRTPSGGSSRQSILVVEGSNVRSRLLSPREAARLMGLPESYALPKKYNDAYRLAGDGVAVPVVTHLARRLLEPILMANESGTLSAAAE